MPVTLNKPFASNVSVDEWDVKQIKKTLNRLGYYSPLETVGITGLADQAVFTGLKQFQKDHGLPPTGEDKPDDVTIKMLNTETAKTPSGFYMWRTVDDGKVRKTHADYNNTVRAWADAPDPGEDYGCRCWAAPMKVPTVNLAKDRVQSILDNTPAVFDIVLDLKAKADAPLYENTILANLALAKHTNAIEKFAKEYHVDPDLVKAVMWSENSRGGQMGLGYVADAVHKSRTILPMNIDPNMWYKLVTNNRSDLYNYDTNIEAGTVLLSRIRDRIKDPTPAKIGAIWEYIGFEKTNNYGTYIGRIYKEKPWVK